MHGKIRRSGTTSPSSIEPISASEDAIRCEDYSDAIRKKNVLRERAPYEGNEFFSGSNARLRFRSSLKKLGFFIITPCVVLLL